MIMMSVLFEVSGQGEMMVVCHCLQSDGDDFKVLRTEYTVLSALRISIVSTRKQTRVPLIT